jgi:hypothetical protein
MTKRAKEIVESLKSFPGSHRGIVWQRDAKVKKDCPYANVRKQTMAYVRAGIDFANLGAVKEGIESGERDEVQALPWGTWSVFPYIIEHKGNEYVRLYPPVFGNLRPITRWFANGSPVEFSAVRPYLLASEMPKDEVPQCFTLKAESIIAIKD